MKFTVKAVAAYLVREDGSVWEVPWKYLRGPSIHDEDGNLLP